MDLALAHPEDLRGSKFSDVARMVDTVERSYAASETDITEDARSFAVRLKWLQTLADELKKREAITVDAEVIDTEPEDPGASE